MSASPPPHATHRVLRERIRFLNREFRTAMMNQKYYRCRLDEVQRLSFWLDLLIAITSSGAIAAWTIWRSGAGAVVWQLAGALTTIIAILKPLLHLPGRIERFSELATGYCTIAFDLEREQRNAQVRGTITDEQWTDIQAIIDRNRDLKINDEVPRERLRNRCYAQVNQEWPIDRLWWGGDQA